jgi:hypothetical protein
VFTRRRVVDDGRGFLIDFVRVFKADTLKLMFLATNYGPQSGLLKTKGQLNSDSCSLVCLLNSGSWLLTPDFYPHYQSRTQKLWGLRWMVTRSPSLSLTLLVIL